MGFLMWGCRVREFQIGNNRFKDLLLNHYKLSMNYLEQLLSEWYEYKGYFVRKNIRVGPRKEGGYECELDIVAFNPKTNHLVHLEPSSDTQTWDVREIRYRKKFDAGKKYIPALFEGMTIPKEIEQEAVFLFGSKKRESIGGGKVSLVSEFLSEMKSVLSTKNIEKEIVPENFPLIRALHIYIDKQRKIPNEELYYCYHNWTAKGEYTIHKANCTRCNYGFGQRQNQNRGLNGVWMGPFSTINAVQIFLKKKMTTKGIKHDCC
jgi:hypothetical protein